MTDLCLTFSEHSLLPTKKVRKRNCPLTAVTALLVATSTVLIVIVLVSWMMTTHSTGIVKLYKEGTDGHFITLVDCCDN